MPHQWHPSCPPTRLQQRIQSLNRLLTHRMSHLLPRLYLPRQSMVEVFRAVPSTSKGQLMRKGTLFPSKGANTLASHFQTLDGAVELHGHMRQRVVCIGRMHGRMMAFAAAVQAPLQVHLPLTLQFNHQWWCPRKRRLFNRPLLPPMRHPSLQLWHQHRPRVPYRLPAHQSSSPPLLPHQCPLPQRCQVPPLLASRRYWRPAKML